MSNLCYGSNRVMPTSYILDATGFAKGFLIKHQSFFFILQIPGILFQNTSYENNYSLKDGIENTN